METFEKSFTVVIGTKNKTLDFFDNPYIDVNVYEINEEFNPTLSKEVKMKTCDAEKDLLKFMDENVAAYYPTALCFEDLSKIDLMGNWFEIKYNSLLVSIDACRNSPEKKTKCASSKEISEFMATNIFYVISQKNIVNKGIFNEDSNKHFSVDDGYFPLENGAASHIHE